MGLALLGGCGGGVLGSAFCPHAGCRATPDARPAPDSHGEHAGAHERATTDAEDHAGHAETHDAGHVGETPSPSRQPRETDGPRGAVSDPHDPSCTHCDGSAEAAPARRVEWRPNSVTKGSKDLARGISAQLAPPVAGFAREIRPAQHAPPGVSDRQLLHGVFRI